MIAPDWEVSRLLGYSQGHRKLTSASRRPVLGSSITGAMPLRFSVRKAGCFSSGVV